MEKLIRRKQKIEQELEYYKEKNREVALKEIELSERLESHKLELEKEAKTFENLSIKLKSCKSLFISLKKEIKKYKEVKITEVRAIYLDKYREYLKEISELDFRFSYNIFSVFELADKLYNKFEFENLKVAFRKYLDDKKSATRERILQSISIKLKDKKKIHEVLFYLRFLVKYELYFQESVMIDFLYDTVFQEFEYHFLSNKETNRLDKPDWIFDFLMNKLMEYKKLYSSYEEIYIVERMSHNNEAICRPSFEDFVLRLKNLINLKINELETHQSSQKRLLILNFGVYLIKYIEQVKSNFNIMVEFRTFSKFIDKIQLDHVIESLDSIHEKKYNEWFPMYEDLTRELMLYIYKFKSISGYLKMGNLVDSILEYNSIFIDSMRYIKREEIKALCYLYTKFEAYKGFLIDTENELIIEKTTNRQKSDDDIKNSFIDEEEMIELLDKITKFNSENLKLIKNLIENDISTLLYTLKRFKYSAETTSRNFIIELSKILEDYKGCKAYRNLHKFTGSLTDKFILEEILLSFKFDKEEFLDFNFFFNKLKQFYNTETWESQEALNCIKDLLEEREGEGPLFSMISKLYEGHLDM